MILEVAGTNTWNKGAELMLVAIRRHFLEKPRDVELAVGLDFGDRRARLRHGLLAHVDVRSVGRSRVGLRLLPARLRGALGVVKDADLDGVLDASGFAFGDQHPPERAEQFAEHLERIRKRRAPVVLMPQALGPFEKPRAREAFRRITACAELVYARDRISLDHARAAAADAGRIRSCPDFTNLVKPVLLARDPDRRRLCIVPNQRMIEKAAGERERDAYLPMLTELVRLSRELGFDPFLLLHGEDDAELLDHLQRRVREPLAVVREPDPVEIKRLIGESHGLVASRFHALASALSQGVPCLGTSWSHKYEMLFEDYGCAEALLKVDSNAALLSEKLDRVFGSGRSAIEATLAERGRVIEARVRAMWAEVDATVGV
ncbi:MAG: polysaccharide pyruvyl transferase family protein [Deltaproteobacteria bacterium]|nr:polysaccharide pyruvyl transferase family protein [Deltaproteobacteria bacterium]